MTILDKVTDHFSVLKLTLLVQIILWLAIAFDIPVVREVAGFIFLTYIPGFLVLRIIKPGSLTSDESIVLSVGLSLGINIALGWLMNLGLPALGVTEPISLLPLIIVTSAVTLILTSVCFIKGRDSKLPKVNIRLIFSPPVLFITLLPIMSILGITLVNFYNFNAVLLMLIVLIALVVIFVGTNRFIPASLYPMAIVACALALVLHRSLVSPHITGADSQIAYYYAQQTLTSFQWDNTLAHNINSNLSSVLLAPIYSDLMQVNIEWLFKIVYPFFYALVPLVVYQVSREPLGERRAFFSSFLFFSLLAFYGQMLGLERQMVSQFFFMLILLLMTMRGGRIPISANKIMTVIFVIGMSVSHYGQSYFFIFTALIALLILAVMHRKSRTLNANVLVLTFIVVMSWYIYNTNSTVFRTVVDMGEHMWLNLLSTIWQLGSREALVALQQSEVTLLHEVTKYLQVITQFFIFIGTVIFIKNRKKNIYPIEFVAIIAASVVWLLIVIIVPFLSEFTYHQARWYAMVLPILAPVAIVGGEAFLGWLMRTSGRLFKHTMTAGRLPARIMTIFLVVYLLFNTGFVYTVAKDPYPTASFDNSLEYARFSTRQDTAALWLLANQDGMRKPFADPIGRYLFFRYFPEPLVGTAYTGIGLDIQEIGIYGGYLYCRVNGNETPVYESVDKMDYESVESVEVIEQNDVIYANPDAEVLFIR